MQARNVPNVRARRAPATAVPTQPSSGKRWFWMGLGLSVVATLSAAAGALLALGLEVKPFEPKDPQAENIFDNDPISAADLSLPRLTRSVNILIVGTKVLTADVGRSPKESGFHELVNSLDGLADTLLLARFDPETGKLVVLSIPRDTPVTVEGLGRMKIASTNLRGGVALAAEATSELLDGIQIDRYVRVNVQGVENLIDTLGGVSVYVPKDMRYQDDSQHLYINLKEGEQHLDGERALQFLRFRHDRLGDIGRVQRQQTFMRALVEQALNPRTLTRIPQIFRVVQTNVDTNLSVEEILALSSFAAQTKGNDLKLLMLPGDFGARPADSSYWVPSRDCVREFAAIYFDANVARDFDNDTCTERFIDPRIAIQDSTDDPEAVLGLKRTLERAGYTNVYISEDWREPLATTRVVAQSGDESAALKVQALLGVGEVRVESTGVLHSAVTIQLGHDWRSILAANATEDASNAPYRNTP
ncbi:cell envelope-related function transcriptional attenuator common domain protein [Rubidibacter lacunae KORDI 51-2]|uniref:Cell envelope-related function transcriptional attenuator common domain protein n=1 Tax=Rubidibacter lacunae KORDI 51-2 TaxID=582515 RepID=U5DGT6_9CHRO|nr:LCP family protein [Rubidibacter lacunae]ERN40482.1 cell envelope-related function transcriptional attenuator common domain protein [Rubidibacter lacunae KORDI 51-2]